ncbi:MAG: hypothetical protein IKS65_09145 [Bacteroidales bacterium]|nr:hypothetical protein [Bacteroidales bacterium]
MKVNKLAFLRRFTFAVLSLLMTANLWGQTSSLTHGDGSSSRPWLIENAEDWAKFVNDVNVRGYNYNGKYVQLACDLGTIDPITSMVGVWSETQSERKPFRGTFSGDNYILTVRYENTGVYTAPFRCTQGATIKRLTVRGDIITTEGYAAGLIGGNYSNKTKVDNNVFVGVNITNGNGGSAGDNCAGIAVDGTYVEISSTVYNGVIVANKNSAGFIVTGSNTSPTYTKINNSLFAPAEGTKIKVGENFVANGAYNRLATSYYVKQIGESEQGNRAYASYDEVTALSGFWKKKTLQDDNDYFVGGESTLDGIRPSYYQNNIQNGGFVYSITFKEFDINIPVDTLDAEFYTAVIYNEVEEPITLQTIEPGDYTLVITGNEGYFKGRLSAEFEVLRNLLDGNGTADSPFIIANAEDWNKFAGAVNGGHTFEGEYLKMDNDITLTIDNSSNSDVMAGVTKNEAGGPQDKWFSGNFDGDWYTLTFNVGSKTRAYNPPHNYSPTAPFRAIDGATIKNLTVEGTFYSSKKYNSGIAGYNYNLKTGRSSYITNCTSSIVVDCSLIGGTSTANNPDCSSSGFVAENKNGSIYFTNCIFNGQIDKGNKTNAQKGAGFVSYNNGAKLYFTNCTMAGTITLTSNKATYWRNGSAECSNAYYINNYGGIVSGCIQATTTVPTNSVARKHQVVDNANTYYVPGGIINGLETTTYTYIEGQSITIDEPTVEYYGRTLRRGSDYVIKINNKLVEGDLKISGSGEFDVKIEGIGETYGGSQTVTIEVINFNSWDVVKRVLADNSKGDRHVVLNADIMPENPSGENVALVANGNVTLDLNNHTIDRHLTDSVVYGQVIRISSGANVTINGPGTITGGYHYPGSDEIPNQNTYYDKRDAGGIHNRGNLVMNNVSVVRNKCVKEAWGSESYTARGGGVYSGPSSSLIINGGNIDNNIARGGGGGVYCDNAYTFILDGVTVSGNQSESKGGGIRIRTTDPHVAVLTDCDINTNLSTAVMGEGGGVYFEGVELHMTGCDIEGNQSRLKGCGFMSVRGTTYATNCNINNNGYFSDEGLNLGGGVCLYDNKGSDHSIFIMDGGTIEGNNSNANGGGIYVYDGAVFQIMGDVIIRDNYMATVTGGATSNNVYLAGTSVIEVIGPLGENAMINITPHGAGGLEVEFAEGASSGSILEDLSHFTLDNTEYNIIIDDEGNIEAYEPYPWNDKATWDGTKAENSGGSGTIPTSESTLRLHRALKIPSGYVAYAGSIVADPYCNIVIEDGGELITGSAVSALVRKDFVAADAEKETGWYLISSSVSEPNIASKTGLITGTSYSPHYDLYRFNEAVDLQWENYRNAEHDDFTTLENGRGYLYRSKDDYTVDIVGTLNVERIKYSLSYHETLSPSGRTNDLKGFNLIGNPYSHTIYKGDATEYVNPAISNGDILESKYYVLNTVTGSWDITDDGTAIPPLTAILVQTTGAGNTLIINNSTEGEVDRESKADRAEKDGGKNIWFTVANGEFEDKACAEFRKGHGLNKIAHQNENAPMLYIRHNDEDFASVDLDKDTKSFDLNFETNTMGRYTLSMEANGLFGYIHLIDKVANKDIDMLKEKEYSFIGSSADIANRFVVRFAYVDDEDDNVFAFQNGDDIIVNGDGDLQVFDLMGRMIASQRVSGVEMVRKPSSSGVYIMRLNDKTQKIVVR